MEAYRKTLPFSQFSQTQIIHIVWLLLLCVSLAAADSMADKTQLPSRDRALKGREEKMVVADKHAVNGNPTVEPFPEGMETIMFGMGCFWGAEKHFWRLPGVFSTQVGYAGGFTPNPTYEEVCSGLTGHTEVVRVVFSPEDISLEELLKHFWENHDPTQGVWTKKKLKEKKPFALKFVRELRQSRSDESLLQFTVTNGGDASYYGQRHKQSRADTPRAKGSMKQHADHGTQYRSAIYASNPAQRELALKSKVAFQQELDEKGYSVITTEILEGQQFYYAEDYHQQYLKKVPKGYCGLKGTGVSCPIGAGKDEL